MYYPIQAPQWTSREASVELRAVKSVCNEVLYKGVEVGDAVSERVTVPSTPIEFIVVFCYSTYSDIQQFGLCMLDDLDIYFLAYLAYI